MTGLGRFGVLNAVLSVDNLGDAGHAAGQSAGIAEWQAATVRALRRRERTTRAVTDQLAGPPRQRCGTRRRGRLRTDRIAALVDRPRRFVAGPHGHTGSVERCAIEADRDQYSELVAGLEADNARLTGQLRARQWRA